MNDIPRCDDPNLIGRSRTVDTMQAAQTPPVGPEPDVPDDPDREGDLPDVNPGSNPANPGDTPGVTDPGKPATVVA